MKFGDWLTLLFIYLKLTNQIDWWWGWVICPAIITLILGFVLGKIRAFLFRLSNLQKKT